MIRKAYVQLPIQHDFNGKTVKMGNLALDSQFGIFHFYPQIKGLKVNQVQINVYCNKGMEISKYSGSWNMEWVLKYMVPCILLHRIVSFA